VSAGTERLRAGVIDAIVAHARAASPSECCGLLLGTGSVVEEARPARNVSDCPTIRFVIDPRDHFDALREGRRHGLKVVGFYHSHPHSPAEPSETDLAEAAYPDHLCLIVSLASDPPDLRLFRLHEGCFHGVDLVAIP
jgi:proteasome lid subunit RPN8/RPN11